METTKSEVTKAASKTKAKPGTDSLRVKRETKKKILAELAILNKKEFGKPITPDQLVSLAIGLIKPDHLQTLKEQSLTAKDHFKLSILGDLYCELNPGTVNPIHFTEEFDRLFPPQASSRDINFLTMEEIKRIFPELLTPSRRSNSVVLVHSFCRFLAATGVRRTEAYDLKHTDIDRETGFIHVRDSKNGESRMIPLDPEAWDAIKDLPQGHEYVFVMKNGQRRHPDSFRTPLQKAAKRAKIMKRIDLHTLRHSYGSNKLRAGWGLRKVSQLLGHGDIRITSEVYAHLLDGDLKVRDEFHFDNQRERENIEEAKKGSFDVAQAIQHLIAALEVTPQGELSREKIATTLKRAFQLPADANSVEPTSATDLQESPSSVTLLLRGSEMEESMSENKKTSDSEFLHLIAGLTSHFQWRSVCGSNELFPPPTYPTDIIWFSPIPLYKDRSFLHQKYVVEGRSIGQIAAEIFSSKWAVREHLLEFGFKLKTVGGQVGRSRKKKAPKSIQPNIAFRRVTQTVTELNNQGMSLRQIAKFLTQTGVPTRGRGKSWHPEMVNRILTAGAING